VRLSSPRWAITIITPSAAALPRRVHLASQQSANTERYYSFDWGNAHFTALDFNTGPDPDQMAWLKEDLAATDKLWKFVFYHQAIYSSGPARLRKLG